MKTFYSQTITFSVFIAIFLFSCVVSEEKENDLTRANLKGNVKSYTVENYYATQSFGEIEKDPSSLMSVVDREYNKSGNMIKYRRISFAPGNDTSSFTQYTYLFNEKQEEVESIKYNSAGRKVNSSIKIYDESGNNIKTTRYEDGAVSMMYKKKYNENNQLESTQHYDADGSESISYSYEYDNLGNNIEEKVFYTDKDLMYKYKRIYDIHNNMKEEIKYDESGITIHHHEYKYDAEGEVVLFYSEIEYTEEGEEFWSKSYEIEEVDEQGNWITLSSTTSNKNYSVINRKIEYDYE